MKLLATILLPLGLLANEPDSVFLFSYATAKNDNHNGLHFAWSSDRQNWHPIGNDYGFLHSDYGRWGSEKRMLDPYLVQTPNGEWHCVWALNERERLFAHAASKDLVAWGRQHYPLMQQGVNCLKPVLKYDGKSYSVYYTDATGKYFNTSTVDFKTFTAAVVTTAYANNSIKVTLPGGEATGQVHKVPWEVVDKLIKSWQLQQYKHTQNAEHTKQDAQRFADLKPLQATIHIMPEKAKPISNLLMGVFFEDINYAADGGLYAELIQNRDFEYDPADKLHRDAQWNSSYAWTGNLSIDSVAPVHPNNPHYAVINNATLQNTGFDGIPVQQNERYNFSVFTKGAGKLIVKLISNGKVLAQTTITANANWRNSTAVLTTNDSAADARLELQATGKIAVDMVSLFPQKTFKGRKNGLRADLAQTIADLRPRFVRFPGGCVAHGDGLHNMYRWKNTVGALEGRVPQRNLWGYHQTAGLGYFEYFQFCEDIGAEPVPVLPAGVPCQNSGPSATGGGQQGGIPLSDMDEYVQEVLDLVEYANGDAKTRWGQLRAKAGHPKPFNLKYIGIGNEDLISDVFEERFTMIYQALKEKHPEITVIGTVGPWMAGTDYTEGWKLANKQQVPMVDEHYYQPPGWFINNQDFYDKYDRNKSKVYLGEYAAHLPGRPNNLETALAEALYLTAVERNGDIVTMTSYAPLLAKEGHTQWKPDLIYFNNTEVKPTTGYQVQKLYGQNSGNEYLPCTIDLTVSQDAVKKRIGVSVVRNDKEMIVKLVNLLPVAVTTNVTGLPTASGTRTVLQGQPADTGLQPVVTSFATSDKLELPPYSFTVLRVK